MKTKHKVNKLSTSSSVSFREADDTRTPCTIENKVGGVYQVRFKDGSTRLVHRNNLVRS